MSPDASHVDWALHPRLSPNPDTVFVDDVHVPVQMAPSLTQAWWNDAGLPTLEIRLDRA
jgi:hypothetical protein